MAVEKKKKSTEEPQIYVGPNVGQGRLAAYTVFREGIPSYLADLQDKHPELNDLIVPVSSLSAVRVKVSKPGTQEYQAYQALSGREQAHDV